ncbi:DUF6804 family protein [Chryseobacterium sp. T1]
MEDQVKNYIKIILAVILLLCLLKMPYGYYQLVRFLALVGFSYLAIDAYRKKRMTEVFVFVALAVLFQPFLKIALGRTLWNIVDVMVAIGLLSGKGTIIKTESQNSDVYLCDSSGGKKYHYTSRCRGLSNCQHKIVKVAIKKAKGMGKTLCGWE